MQMKNKENQFRILAVFLSMILFCAGIILTLGIFLPVIGLALPKNALFDMGRRVFSVYGFSAFLIPLVFLYGAVLLLIPGWSRESKAVLLGVPLYFVTAIIGEKLIYIFSPSVSIPIIRHFVIISILICALLLVCFEIFLMLTLSEKLAGRRFFARTIPVADIVSETDAIDEAEDIYVAEKNGSVTASAPEAAGHAEEAGGIRPHTHSEMPMSDEPTVKPSETAAITESKQTVEEQPAAVSDKRNNADSNIPAAVSNEPEENSPSRLQEVRPEILATEYVQVRMQDKAVEPVTAYNAGSIAAEELVADTTRNTAGTVSEEAVAVSPPAPIAAEDELVQTEEALPILEEAEAEYEEMEAPVEQVKAVQENDNSAASGSPAAVEDTDEEPAPAARPVFDPSDPDNLFTSLEEITAPIERIKRADYTDAEVRKDKQDTGAEPVAIAFVPQEEDTAEYDEDALLAEITSPSPVDEVVIEDNSPPATVFDGPDTIEAEIFDMPTAAEIAAADAAEREESAAIMPEEEDTPEASEQEDRETLQPAAAEIQTEQADMTAVVTPLAAEMPVDNSVEAAAEPIEEASVSTEPADEPAAEENVAAPLAHNTVYGEEASADPLEPGAAYPVEEIADRSESESFEPEEDTAADEEAVDESWEPVMPLVFVNGVPLPNERSDLLDTMVVIDSEPQASFEPVRKEETASYRSEATAAMETDTVFVMDDDLEERAIIDDEADEPEEKDFTGSEIDDRQETREAAAATIVPDTSFLETIEQTAVVPVKPVIPQRKKYAIPFDLLTNYPDGEYWIVDDATRRSALMLKSTFNEFKIDVSITGIRKGPVVTMFEMLPSPGIKLSKITNLQDNIALRLAASSVRIVAPIPGKHAVGIEVPNKKRSIVSFRELIEADLPESAKMAIPIALGKDVTGNPQLVDLAQTPHLLIAGATGSGKSVCVNSIILSILYNRRPDEVKLILVDPKIVELKLYNDIAHLLTPVITEPKRAFQALQYAICEMERRYALLDNMGVRDIKTFNAKIKSERIATEALPYIVIIIDEFADLMATSGKELEATVARLCAMSRAVGIHLVLATQRPSIDVITGLIKANIPSRIAFMVASKTDSRIILDEMGAEKLLGKGDMLYVSAAQPFPTRMQGAFVSEQEVERVVACVKEYCEPEYIDDEIFVDDDDDSFDSAVFSDENDPLYDQALEIVTFAGKASASYVQRKLKIGYNRAARLIEEMEARGIVGPANGSKAREIIRHV